MIIILFKQYKLDCECKTLFLDRISICNVILKYCHHTQQLGVQAGINEIEI